MFEGGQPSEQDLLRRQEFASDTDPILSYVRWMAAEDDDLYECGPTGLQRYRALRSEMERANALSDVRTCDLCISEGIPHTEVVCIHAFMGQTPTQRTMFDPICSGWTAPPPTAGLAPRALTAPAIAVAPTDASIVLKPQPRSPPPPPPLFSPAVTSIAPAGAVVGGVLAMVPATSSAPRNDAPSASSATSPPSASDAPPSTAIVPAPVEIGSDVWKELPEEQRHKSLRSLYETASLQSLQLSGVKGMIRTYLRQIAPLERLPSKRGYGWRDARFAGATQQEAWSDLLNKWYEPILCGVLAYMDENDGTSIWAAADAVEDKRQTLGTFEKLMGEFKQYKGKALVRAPFMARLQDAEFATAALDLLVAPPAPPPSDGSEAATEEVDEEALDDSPLAVAALEGAATRILGLDPSLSCGFSIVQLNASGEILSIDMGVLDVSDKSLTDGARCLELQRLLRPLLSPRPDHVYVEPFFGHGRQCDAISYMLRAAIAMVLAEHEIVAAEVCGLPIEPRSAALALCVCCSPLARSRVVAGASANLEEDHRGQGQCRQGRGEESDREAD